ncbi:hypothetical protein AAOGI_10390 [Agarivorans albus]
MFRSEIYNMNHQQKVRYILNQIETLEVSIVDKATKDIKLIKKAELGHPDFVKLFILDHFRNYEGRVTARYMIIIQLYSLFERLSVKYSNEISTLRNVAKISSLNGKKIYFETIKKFYSEIFNISFSKWEELDDLRLVRNIVAHSDGYVLENDWTKRAEALNLRNSNISILCDGRLVFNKEFLVTSTHSVLNFFNKIEPEIAHSNTALEFGDSVIDEFWTFDQTET